MIIKLDSFIVLVLGFLINREPFVLLEVLGMLICFGAILAMALSAAKESEASEEVRTEQSKEHRLLGILMALIVACFGGTIPILTRKLKDIPATLMMFYLGIVGSLIMGIWIAVETVRSENGSLQMTTYTAKQFALITSSTVFSAIATTSYTVAY